MKETFRIIVVLVLSIPIGNRLLQAQLVHPWHVNSRGSGKATGGSLTLTSSIGLNTVAKSVGMSKTLEPGFIPGTRIYTASTKTISGITFNDLNGNGVQDVSDTVLSAWKIYLKNSSNLIIDSAVTDVYGDFTFSNVADGAYYLAEAQQASWYQTHPADGDSYTILMSNGISQPGNNFGNIFGYKFIGSSGGAWSIPSNWSGNRPPGPDDAAIVPKNKQIVVDTLSHDSINVLIVSPGGTLSFSSTALPLKVRGAIRNDSGATMTFSGSSISSGLICYSDFINGGTFNAGNSKIHFRGSQPKTIISAIHGPSNIISQGTTFYDLSIEGSGTSSSGNLSIQNVLTLNNVLTQDSRDTIRILNSSDTALTGSGEIASGTVGRMIASGSTAAYRFESNDSYIRFINSGGCGGQVFVTTQAGINPLDFGSLWRAVPSAVDTSLNKVFADSLTNFSKWGIGRPRVLGASPDIHRLYTISVVGCNNFVAQLELHYDQTEVPAGVREDSLVLMKGVLEVADGWNMVSVPLTVSDYHKSAIYPTAVGNAFSFQGSYTSQTLLLNGVGYWLKFSGVQTIPMDGDTRSSDVIDVQQGWNMIGSVSQPVKVASIVSSPPSIVTSQFFGYDAAYYSAATIEPGKAYWVKINQSGQLTLSNASNAPLSNRIRIISINERPPLPPGGGETPPAGGPPRPAMPDRFGLDQNYPNPFNPSTVIHFQLPLASKVSLRVYNIVGQLVATLVDEVEDAGYKSIEWKTTDVASGVYFYKLTAGEFVSSKKMILVR